MSIEAIIYLIILVIGITFTFWLAISSGVFVRWYCELVAMFKGVR